MISSAAAAVAGATRKPDDGPHPAEVAAGAPRAFDLFVGRRFERQKHVDSRDRATREVSRRDTNDRVAVRLDRQHLSDDRRVAAEPSLPESVTEHRHARRPVVLALVCGVKNRPIAGLTPSERESSSPSRDGPGFSRRSRRRQKEAAMRSRLRRQPAASRSADRGSPDSRAPSSRAPRQRRLLRCTTTRRRSPGWSIAAGPLSTSRSTSPKVMAFTPRPSVRIAMTPRVKPGERLMPRTTERRLVLKLPSPLAAFRLTACASRYRRAADDDRRRVRTSGRPPLLAAASLIPLPTARRLCALDEMSARRRSPVQLGAVNIASRFAAHPLAEATRVMTTPSAGIDRAPWTVLRRFGATRRSAD